MKIAAPSNLDKLAQQLKTAHGVIVMIQKHESLGRVNVHSHGAIIADIVELTRRSHELAKAFQLEIQGR